MSRRIGCTHAGLGGMCGLEGTTCGRHLGQKRGGAVLGRVWRGTRRAQALRASHMEQLCDKGSSRKRDDMAEQREEVLV